MTKSELLADVASKYDMVDTEVLEVEDSPTGYNKYYVKVWDIANSIILSDYIHFYVYDEGGGSEAAYYFQKEPKPRDFLADVEVFIEDELEAENGKGVFIDEIDEINEKAILRFINNNFVETYRLADRDGNGDIQTTLIT